jgi:hypothetical protein
MNRNLTLSVDEQLLEQVREKFRASGKTVNEAVREYFKQVVGGDGQLERDLEFLERTAGLGDSKGWKFNREELYERR